MNEKSNKWIGQRTIRPDGAEKVTGSATFAADTAMAGMIWGKVLRSPHAHACCAVPCILCVLELCAFVLGVWCACAAFV